MNKKIKALIAVAAISGTVGGNVQAAEITVTKGDTIWGISQTQNESVEKIKSLNKLTSDVIYPGDKLIISQETNYMVQLGDSLWEIAKNNNVSVDEIKKWNSLTDDIIQPGMKLVLYKEQGGNLNPIKTEQAGSSIDGSTATNSQATAPTPVTPSIEKSTVHAVPQQKESQPQKTDSQKIKVKATAYTASCTGCSGVTATGINIKDNQDAKVIAVDPSVIPLGSKVYVEGYGYATASDTGGAIKGKRIDVFIPSEKDAMQWGSKQVNVTIIN
ncbi:MAG: LysM peptidoglycan-binding domain-containing protein [Bacillota bacterium]|nr:LysM peptidoglycan-binding domain-containing protein [Bacillota bacterium]